jgi:hypothetical protein
MEGQHGLHVDRHALPGPPDVSLGIFRPQLLCLPHREPARDIHQWVVGRSLIGHHVRDDAPAGELGEDLGGVAQQPDGTGLPRLPVAFHPPQGLLQILHDLIEEPVLQASPRPARVHLHDQAYPLVHRDGQGLGAAHLPQARRQHPLPLKTAPEMSPGTGRQRLVGSLEDALRADIDPGPGRHLAEHDQALALQLVEDLPGGPVGDQVAVGDQDAGGQLVGAEDGDRLAGLHQKGFVGLQVAEGFQDRVEAFPVAGRLAAAAVDDQVRRIGGHLRIQVVLDHPVGRFDLPVLAG